MVKLPNKKQARIILRSAVQKKIIEYLPCEKCGSEINIQAHHTDYSKPLKITWLCRKHHYEWHSKNPNPKGIIDKDHKALMVKPDIHLKIVVEAKKRSITIDTLIKELYENKNTTKKGTRNN